jgi:GNAT superfamily N-acetyltransferase
MEIRYETVKEFDKKTLQELFLSVQWSSGNYPDQLQAAIRNSHRVFSAWDGDRLVGLVNALSDGVMTAYIHYMLVRPEYQKQGIGKHLITLLLQEYKDYARKVLIAYDSEVDFYRHCGFEPAQGCTPMFITFLST